MKNEYDLLKALAILLVVLGHVTNHYQQLSVVTSTVYVFHIPLFISLSGAIFHLGCERGKYVAAYPFFLNKIRRIIVPLVFTATVVLMPTMVLLGNSDYGAVRMVCEILKGGEHTKHLWYLQAVFIMFLGGWVINRFKVNLFVSFVVIWILTIIAGQFGMYRITYFSLGLGLSCFPFFVLGMVLSQYRKISPLLLFLIAGLLLLGWAMISLVAANGIWGGISKSLLRVASVVGLYSVARLIFVHLQGLSSIVGYIVMQSFPIYLFHMTFLYVLRYALEACCVWWVMVLIEFTIALLGSIILARIIRWIRMGALIGEG